MSGAGPHPEPIILVGLVMSLVPLVADGMTPGVGLISSAAGFPSSAAVVIGALCVLFLAASLVVATQARPASLSTRVEHGPAALSAHVGDGQKEIDRD